MIRRFALYTTLIAMAAVSTTFAVGGRAPTRAIPLGQISPVTETDTELAQSSSLFRISRPWDHGRIAAGYRNYMPHKPTSPRGGGRSIELPRHSYVAGYRNYMPHKPTSPRGGGRSIELPRQSYAAGYRNYMPHKPTSPRGGGRSSFVPWQAPFRVW